MKKNTKSQRLEIRISADQKKFLQNQAHKANMSVSEMIIRLIESKPIIISHEHRTNSILIVNRICNLISNTELPDTLKQSIEKELNKYV